MHLNRNNVVARIQEAGRNGIGEELISIVTRIIGECQVINRPDAALEVASENFGSVEVDDSAIVAAEPDHGRARGLGVAVLATLGEAERAREWIARGRLVDTDNVNLHINFA